MANSLPPIWRWDFSDYTSLGATFQKFLSNLNLFSLAVYNLLNGGIGYANLQQAVYKFTIQASTITSVSFANPLSIAPSAVVLGQVILQGNTSVAIANAVSVGNWLWDGKYIQIGNIAGLTAGSTYNVTVIVS
jgi:hypothetical protein